MGLLTKSNALNRLTSIQDTAKKMDDLEKILVDALECRGNLTQRQRADVLKRVVDTMKEKSRDNLKALNQQLIEVELADDVLKSIML